MQPLNSEKLIGHVNAICRCLKNTTYTFIRVTKRGKALEHQRQVRHTLMLTPGQAQQQMVGLGLAAASSYTAPCTVIALQTCRNCLQPQHCVRATLFVIVICSGSALDMRLSCQCTVPDG